MRRHLPLLVWAQLVFGSAVVLLIGCGGGDSGGSTAPAAPTVASVAVTPGTATLGPGQTVQLIATARSAGGGTVSGQTMAWSSSDSQVAAVSTSGLVTANAPGSATITATTSGRSGTAIITVVASTIQGTVTAATMPAAGVTVTLSGAGGGVVPTATDGTYRFEGLAPGDYTVTISEFSPIEFENISQSLSLGVGETATVDFAGTVQSCLAGTVTTSPAGSSALGSGSLAVSGELTTSDCVLEGDGTFYDLWDYAAEAGSTVQIDAVSTAFDTFIWLVAPDGTVVLTDDDGGDGSNSRIEFTFPETATYSILVTSFLPGATGAYTLTVTPVAGAGSAVWGSLSTGDVHTCGVTQAGVAYCWGRNITGSLGDGTTIDRFTPTAVVAPPALTIVEAGTGHTCGLTGTGTAYCWGSNLSGQLGNGTRDASVTPVLVLGGLSFTQITLGLDHTCAVTAAGAAYCWGNNLFGQLGDGGQFVQTQPTLVLGGLTFTRVQAGPRSTFTCGITTGGAINCWGLNIDGELGDGTTVNRNVPGPVSGGTVFTSLAVGGKHACGIDAAGAAQCWGRNNSGQIGDGSNTDRNTPVPVSGGLSFVQLTGGGSHTCGLTALGSAECWGSGFFGEIGNGATNDQTAPVSVSGGFTFGSIFGGNQYTCALTTAGTAYCWGNDDVGQTGTDTSPGFLTSPTPVRDPS